MLGSRTVPPIENNPVGGDSAVLHTVRPGARELPKARPSTVHRVVFAILLGTGSGLLHWAVHPPGSYPGDFDQLWYAARAIREGLSPYTTVGPGLLYDFPFPFYYPLPAGIAAIPLSFLPLRWAAGLFTALACGLLGFGITRDGWMRLPIVTSGAFLFAVLLGQPSLLIVASLWLPALAVFACGKPNLAFAVATSEPKRHIVAALIGGCLLLGISFALQSQWLGEWIATVRETPGPVNITASLLGGPLLLLALLRWRRPEARLLLAFACIPRTTLLYDTLALFYIVQTRTEALLLAILSMTAFVGQRWLAAGVPYPEDLPRSAALIAWHNDWAAQVGILEIGLLFLPCLIMILRRPNEGAESRRSERILET